MLEAIGGLPVMLSRRLLSLDQYGCTELAARQSSELWLCSGPQMLLQSA